MGDLQFDSDQQNEFSYLKERQKSGFDLTGNLIQWGIVSDRKQAEYMLIGVGVAAILLAWLFWPGGGQAPIDEPAPPEVADAQIGGLPL